MTLRKRIFTVVISLYFHIQFLVFIAWGIGAEYMGLRIGLVDEGGQCVSKGLLSPIEFVFVGVMAIVAYWAHPLMGRLSGNAQQGTAEGAR